MATLTLVENELGGEPDLDWIANELGSLAAALAATTCRFLLLLAEFDQRAGWQSQGIASTSQWLSWRCGINGTTAREQVRVLADWSICPRPSNGSPASCRT